MTAPIRSVGVIGSGKLGTTLARLFVQAGIDVRVASRTPPAELAFMLDLLVPGARGTTVADAFASDAVVLALPFAHVPALAASVPAGALVVDATNYWAATDGAMPAFAAGRTASEAVAAALPGATVVKAFNHLGYHDLDSRAGKGIALAVAADDAEAAARVRGLVEAVGFVPVPLPALADGRVLEVGGPVFGGVLTADALSSAIGVPAG